MPRFVAKGPKGKALVALAKRFQLLYLDWTGYSLSLLQASHTTGYFNSWKALGSILECKRNKLVSEFLNKLLLFQTALLFYTSAVQSLHQAQNFWVIPVYKADFLSQLGKWVRLIKIEAEYEHFYTRKVEKPQNNTSSPSFTMCMSQNRLNWR